MNVIKLDAIDSTNDFLKRLNQDGLVKNWTVVVAESQFAGKGQMGAKWVSEKGKNLTMSILVKNIVLVADDIFKLNVIVSLSIIEILQDFEIPNLSIKWPNDIMSANKKIGGILIENVFTADKKIVSIIGIGLNVNQTNFTNLPKASSLSVIKGKNFDKELLLKLICDKIDFMFSQRINQKTDYIWHQYNQYLFKKGVPMPFENSNGHQFMAIINEVDAGGKLVLQLEDDSFTTFEVKEVQMLY